MKNYNVFSKRGITILITLFTLIFSEYVYCQLSSPNGIIDLRNQRLFGDDASGLYWDSNHSRATQIIFRDKEDEQHGRVIGSGDGAYFGLMDGDTEWSYLAAKDLFTDFRINNLTIMKLKHDGKVGIGTNSPQYELDVCGVIRAKEVLVEDNWCDFVFEPEYCLTTLEEEEEFIKLYGHLSNFESAKTMNGEINVNDIFKRQQIQIEENVLHLIEINEENEVLQIQVDDLTDEVNQLNEKVSTLTVNYEALAKELAVIKKQLR